MAANLYAFPLSKPLALFFPQLRRAGFYNRVTKSAASNKDQKKARSKTVRSLKSFLIAVSDPQAPQSGKFFSPTLRPVVAAVILRFFTKSGKLRSERSFPSALAGFLFKEPAMEKLAVWKNSIRHRYLLGRHRGGATQ